ncbi:uncharacterized protein LOC107980540 [Nasonia vitripennis]|uniref:Uncharacterized protein n=1 Tax=Nasonia vitripennis TaxID=7425 RepID=A0A7M7ITV8_NASVI|nr:uncharacterized protein LOC107980540 [Nasonia vitripennis]
MSKLNPLLAFCFALLCFSINIDAQSLIFTKKYSIEYFQLNQDFVVKSNNSIMIVGVYNNFVNMTTLEGDVINICEYSIPPEEAFFGINEAVALGNGKIVVNNWLNMHEVIERSLIVIVDPHNCSSTKTLVMVQKEGERLGIKFLVPYHDSFDLYFWNNTIARYSDSGERIHLDYQLDVGPNSREEYLRPVKPYDPSEGYFFSQIIYDNSTRLKRLDSRFQTIKETYFAPDVREISTTYNKVSFCRQYEDRKVDQWHSSCYFYDAQNLSRRASVQMYGASSDFQLSHAVIANLPDGSSLVALSFELGWFADEGYAKEYYLQRVYADGTTGKPVFVDTYYNTIEHVSRTSMILLDGGELCLIVQDLWFEYRRMKRRVNTKCFILD